jgi:hypothetical protein
MVHTAKYAEINDIQDASSLLRIIEEVRATGEPCVLRRGHEEIAQITPLKAEPRKRRKGRGLTPNDPLLDIIGIGKSDIPTDIAANKAEYLAHAYEGNRP